MDIKAVYLNARLEDIYVNLPEGMNQKRYCKLKHYTDLSNLVECGTKH